MQTGDKKAELRKLLERLHDPFQLRVFITVLALAVGFVAVYMPLDSRIEETTRKLNAAQRRHDLAHEIEDLRGQVEGLQARLPEDTDTNEWVQYVLDGIRKFPVKLTTLDSGKPQQLGPYEAVVLQLELEGVFEDIDSFLDWVESNERLFRLDSAKIAPPRNEDGKLSMHLTLLGLKG